MLLLTNSSVRENVTANGYAIDNEDSFVDLSAYVSGEGRGTQDIKKSGTKSAYPAEEYMQVKKKHQKNVSMYSTFCRQHVSAYELLTFLKKHLANYNKELTRTNCESHLIIIVGFDAPRLTIPRKLHDFQSKK